MSKWNKRLAAMEKLLADIEVHRRGMDDPAAPIKWGSGAPGLMEIFLAMPKRIGRTDDNELKLKFLFVMYLALALFFDHLKKNPNCRRILDPQKVLELVGIAQRYAPKWKEFAAFYKTHAFTDGKLDREKLKELGCPILV
jgi:hypothetical protein